MKIRKIELINHPFLNNLKMDFTDETGNVIDTIIFAGENGTGKTSVLDLLFDLSKIRLGQEKRDEQRTFEIEFTDEELLILSGNVNYKSYFTSGFENGMVTITFDYNIIGDWSQIKLNFKDKNGHFKNVTGDLLAQQEIMTILRFVYSDVEINYIPKQINSVTAKDIDTEQNQSSKSNNNLATDITQLLIDIEALDSQEFARWGKQNPGAVVDENMIDVRIKRFTKAFDSIFPSKKFLGIENQNNLKQVFFKEDGKRMTIDKLSSGEKQIVFRGGFLLKDKGVNAGSVFLIDEPEISLHPKWQIEILDFYKRIINEDSHKSSQIFIATHSPFIIHNPNRRNDKVLILTRGENGNIISSNNPEFYSWTNKEIVKEAFRVEYDLANTKNKMFLEGVTDEMYFTKAREIFNLDSVLSFDISWIGRINENGHAEFTGDTALNHFKSLVLANSDLIQSKIILYFDSDTNKPDETFGNLLIRKMPKIETNDLYTIGVENLLNLPKDFDKSLFYTEKKNVNKYGAESTIRDLNKSKLAKWICQECDVEKQRAILKNLESLLILANEELK